jgi:hypothetical protein
MDQFLARRTISEASVFSSEAATKGNIDKKRRDEKREEYRSCTYKNCVPLGFVDPTLVI